MTDIKKIDEIRTEFMQNAFKISDSCYLHWGFLLKNGEEKDILLYPFSRFFEYIFNKMKVDLSFIPNLMTDEIIRILIARDMKNIIIHLVQRPIIWEYHVVKNKNSLQNRTFLEFLKKLSEKIELNIFLKKYPVLDEILFNLLCNYNMAQSEFLSRLHNNFIEISSFFSLDKIQLIDFEIKGDSHCFGRRTTQVYFMSLNKKKSVMYKPRDMALEVTFQKYIDFINDFSDDIKLYRSMILSKGEYGWEKYISHTEIQYDLIPFFYCRFGFILGMAYSLNGIDLHFENLIAHADSPQFIDFECLFTLPITQEQQADPLWPSLCDTSMVPALPKGDRHHYDFSALLFHDNQISPNMVIEIQGLGSDHPVAIRKNTFLRPSKNYLFLSNKENRVSPLKYQNDIVKGFLKYMDILIKKRYEIAHFIKNNFGGLKNRILFKATFLYDKVMKESYHPKLLSNRTEYVLHLQQLKNKDVSEMLDCVFNCEIDDIMRGDIPFFTSKTDVSVLLDSRENKIPFEFFDNGLERAINKINSYDLYELQKHEFLIREIIKANYDK